MTGAFIISTLKKYLFGLLVFTYVITVVGVPVYLHYCGGKLEMVNYVLEADSCCGGEEQEEPDNDCCKNEGLYLLNSQDFTIKDADNFDVIKSVNQLFCLVLPFTFSFDLSHQQVLQPLTEIIPDPALLQISVTVLRV